MVCQQEKNACESECKGVFCILERKNMVRKRWILIAVMVLLSSCAPVISQETLSQSDRHLTFQELIRNPDQYRGTVIVIGGRIIGISHDNEETWLEVLQQPLGRRYKPERSDESHGRFLVRFREQLDPEIYRNDRLITVAGEVEGARHRLIDTLNYNYLVVMHRESHIWPLGEAGGSRFHFGIGINWIFH